MYIYFMPLKDHGTLHRTGNETHILVMCYI